MADIQIGAHTYRLAPLTPRVQLHVSRRIAPVLASAGGILSGLFNNGALAGLLPSRQGSAQGDAQAGQEGASSDAPTPGPNLSPEALGVFASLLTPVLTVIGQMEDADVDYILDRCLACAIRQNEGGTGWSPLMRNGDLMFQDITGPQMIEIAARVLIGEAGSGGLGDFFAGLFSTIPGARDPA